MTMTRREIVKGAASIISGTVLAPNVLRAQAQFPNRNIRVIVPFPAGATTDMLARLIANRVGESLGQSVVVENVGGAGGSLGADQVASRRSRGVRRGRNLFCRSHAPAQTPSRLP